jgi:gas vesicle protein
MQWFEYDKAEEMLEAIQNNIESLENDISIYEKDLSRTSLIAMKNEVGRLTMHLSDIQEMINLEDSQKNPTILEGPS